ncbi:hypothetical protein [Saccharibacillus kuerlensis]|uniref:Uncharacterized protein n=1 Tax=Saccharibacillus kuerlensis TaxID=459527 RepID=A0ABQ2KVW0_9BACL|nr:hypothetical protein [Saccharibacillus kuerlensis]GGN94965.1 hypothetical protein GCM10010969_10180 [Saccharibacillus kuerlensis]
MFNKRGFQRIKRTFKQAKPGLTRWGFFLSTVAFILTYVAERVYLNNPHAWYDITGREDILLLGLALVFSLVHMYIKISLLAFELYLGVGNPKLTILSILAPFIFILHSLFTMSPLYIMPLLMIVLLQVYNYFRAQPPKLA